MRVRAKKNRSECWLTPGKEYMIIGISDNYLRVIDDGGKPTLFLRELFDIIDDELPLNWIIRKGDDGEIYANPPGLHEPGFYEDLFEKNACSRTIFTI